MDRRLTPANGRVAALSLQGQVEAERFTEGSPRSVAVPVLDLRRAPGGPRDRQLLLGAEVTVFEEVDGWAFVQATRDGYVGYVRAAALSAPALPTHYVATMGTHAYEAEDIKSPDLVALPFGARVRVLDERHKLFETPLGFVPKKHLWPITKLFADPVVAAQIHFGVPYLWGGNSTRGIDCSGLVQAALQAGGIACPGDSDLQAAALGEVLPGDATLRRGDLLFWKGHVAMLVDGQTLIHASGHHMAVAYEPLADAELRIIAQGGGGIIARRRP